MPADDRAWISQVIHTARESFEQVFDIRTVRLLFLGGLSFAVAWIASTKQLSVGPRLAGSTISGFITAGFAAVGFVLVGLTIGSGLMTLRRPSAAAANSARKGLGSVLGGQLILGIEVSRNAISYGALSLKLVDNRGEDAPVLAQVRTDELIPTRTRVLELSDGKSEMYAELTAVVLDLLSDLEQSLEQEVVVSGVAITTPSSIDIRSKTLISTTGPFPVNERLADGLARNLWERHRARVQQCFGTSKSPIVGEQDLAEKIYLDVDSRSIARYDLHHRLRNDGNWRNYACVIVLEGVGAGMVLDREVYYGSHSAEGEIGHTTVHLTTEFIAPGPLGRPVDIGRCDCQLPGLHYESLSSILGLVRLAESCDREAFDRLTAVYGHALTSQDLIHTAAIVKTGEPAAEVPRDIVRTLTGDPRLREYLDRVINEYARILTIGIANLVNTLDLEHVVIGGPIIRDLDRLGFRNEIWNCWNDYVLGGRNVGYSFESLKQRWQGAALLFWDPAYRRNLS